MVVGVADYRRHRQDTDSTAASPRSFAGLRSVPASGTGSVKHRSPQRPAPSAPPGQHHHPRRSRPATQVPQSLNDGRCSARAPRGQQARKISHHCASDVATFGATAEACANHLATAAQIAATSPPGLANTGEEDTRRSKRHAIGRVRFGARPDEPPANLNHAADDEQNAP